MSMKSSRRAKKRNPNVEKDNHDHDHDHDHDHSPPSNTIENQLQIVCVSPPFKLPDDWLIEERPRPGPNPSHRIDRYYYEPKTRRKFRSLIAVQRYLREEEEVRDYDVIVSENKDNNYIESGTEQQSRPVRAYEGRLTGENACTATPKLMLKFGSGKRSAHGVRNFQNPVKKCFSVGEDKTTWKASKSKHSKKADSQKKVNFGEEESVHNLTRPPAKVRWVLSGSGGYWRPFLDDSIVPESEKLKWSEAFVQSIHEGYGQ